MADILDPDEIQNTTFPEAEHGYDTARVDSFLHTMSEEVRELQRELEVVTEKAERPYLAVGKELGDLLQRAHDVAKEVMEEAEAHAAKSLQHAHHTSDKANEDATKLKRETQEQVESQLNEAKYEAEQMKEQALKIRKRSEAEGVVLRQEAGREAKLLLREAKQRSQVLHEDIRKLEQTESSLRRRVETLSDQLQSLQQQLTEGHANGPDAEASKPPEDRAPKKQSSARPAIRIDDLRDEPISE